MLFRSVKQTHHCQPPQFSTSHHKPTKPHHKFNKSYQIHHQLPQIQSSQSQTQEQIHITQKNKVKPTTKSNRRHRRGVAPKQPPTTYGKPQPTKKPITSSTNKSRERERERPNPIGEAQRYHRKTTSVVTIASLSGSHICSCTKPRGS